MVKNWRAAAQLAVEPAKVEQVEVVNAQLTTGPYLFIRKYCRFALGRKTNWKERERNMARIAKKKADKPARKSAMKKTAARRSGSARRKSPRKARAARKSPARRKAAA